MHLCFFVLDLHQFIYDEMKAFLFLDGQKVKFLKYYHNVSDKFYRIQRGERQRTLIFKTDIIKVIIIFLN